MTTTSKTIIILNSQEDWDLWIETIKTAAMKEGIWEYINPDVPRTITIGNPSSSLATVSAITTVVQILTAPIEPTFIDVRLTATSYEDLTAGELFQLRRLITKYDKDLKTFEEKTRAMAELREVIQEHIKKDFHQYIWRVENPYDMLIELKRIASPTDTARERQLITQWGELKRKPGRGANIDTWLMQWEFLYDRCRTMKIPDVEGNRASYDFLAAIEPISGAFTSTMIIALNQTELKRETPQDFKDLVRAFREYRRVSMTLPGSKASVFAVDIPKLGSLLRNEKSKPLCICNKNHYWNECPYLNPKVRTKDWKEDLQIRNQVDEKVKEKPYIAEKAKEEGWRSKWKPNFKAQNNFNRQNSPKPPTALVTTAITSRYQQLSYDRKEESRNYSEVTFFENLPQNSLILEAKAIPESDSQPIACAFTASAEIDDFIVSSDHQESPYELSQSVILDSGATIHVCNNRTKLIDFRPAFEGEKLLAGSSYVSIVGWGTMQIQVKNGNAVRSLDLKNTAFIPNFLTNLASLRLFIQGGVHWDTRRNRLTYGEGLKFCDVEAKHDQWVLQYEPIATAAAFPASSYKPRKVRKSTTDELHRLMGHLHFDSVAHLPESTRGIEVTNTDFDQNCEVCRRTKATRIPSRRPRDRALAPYERISWDLIEMRVGVDDNRYASHFLDDDTRMNHFVALPDKKQTTIVQSFRNLLALVRNWGFRPRIFKFDNDKSLGGEMTTLVNEEGLTLEYSPPYTPEPNGLIERSGRTLIVRARCLKEDSGLPADLWPEMYGAAAYLLNRSPIESLGWKTPIGFLEERLKVANPQPQISHLVSYGCRGYVFINNQPKLDRQEPRANIGYLVGYESTNIFRLWVPALNKVVATRDVRFDETKFYKESFDQNQEKIREEEESQANQTISVPRISQNESSYEETRIWETEDNEVIPQKDSSYETPANTTTHLLTPETTPAPEVQQIYQNLPSQYVHTEELRELREEPVTISQTLASSSSNTSAQSAPITKLKPSYEVKMTKGKEIGLEINPDHIVEGKRTRTKKTAHVAQLEHEGLEQQYSAFVGASAFNKPEETKIHRTKLQPPPRNFHQLVRHEYADGFKKAMDKEWETLWRKGTMTEEKLTDMPTSDKVVPVMWVFTYKFDEDGYLVKYKARLVVRGDLWHMRDEKEKYAATLASRTFRCLMAIAAFFDLDIFQFDAINAFTNADIDERVHIRAPDGFQKPGVCYRLLKALYGLPRSPLLWFNDIARTMKEFGLTQIPEAQCLFVSKYLFVFFYVDDIVILCHPSQNKHYEELRTKLTEKYELRKIEKFEWFLGVRVVRDRVERKIWLCQDAYWENIATKFGLTKGPFPHTPMATENLEPYKGRSTPQMILSYGQRVGSVNCPAVVTRPDMARTAQKLSEFLVNPGPDHIKAADRAISYGYGSRTMVIEYNSSLEQPVFQASSDAAFADDPQSQLLMWIRFFESINLDLSQEYKIFCDNLQTVRLMLQETPKLVTKLKHIDIQSHWLRQEVKSNRFKVEWVTTTEMKADGFTKSLSRQKHETFVRQLNLVDIQDKL